MKGLARLFVACAVAVLALPVGGCDGSMASSQTEQAGMELARTAPGSPEWQPFTKGSVWNLHLPSPRQEMPLPLAGLMVAPLSLSDGAYGIKIYFAADTDPMWQVSFDDFNSTTDNWMPANPLSVRAPAILLPPTGSDGTVIVVDENRQYVYELWQFSVTQAAQDGGAPPQAHCASLNVSDLRSDGIHRNVGVTAAGLPGIGGVLRNYEIETGVPIQHKIWLAVHPDLLLAQAVWPANQFDVPSPGADAAVSYGDVIALAQSYDVENGECNLSPLMQRVAHGLQDFGGIVQDRGGDAVGLVSEVGAISTHLDTDQQTMWDELSCLRQHLVRVANPWMGATPGGLGY